MSKWIAASSRSTSFPETPRSHTDKVTVAVDGVGKAVIVSGDGANFMFCWGRLSNQDSFCCGQRNLRLKV